ncbi:hypothetical protein BS47DRAFT_1397778 [Hydnum rufescens UP504]|uniref:Uncharacterized protein n=1 Tax=Hydnum rufescens UP504 TaxID=1448309 RepID=A0A9P6AMD8_9AGAM|nr:hypothetical protein BS47DRAFT_1397778 [Hydnum rufescens UP504]
MLLHLLENLKPRILLIFPFCAQDGAHSRKLAAPVIALRDLTAWRMPARCPRRYWHGFMKIQAIEDSQEEARSIRGGKQSRNSVRRRF